LFNKNVVKKIRIIYGGSVNSRNIHRFLKEKGIEGALIGAASLKVKDFIKSVRIANKS